MGPLIAPTVKKIEFHKSKMAGTAAILKIVKSSYLCNSLPILMKFGTMTTWAPEGGAENASTGKRKYGKAKYETANFARMENA